MGVGFLLLAVGSAIVLSGAPGSMRETYDAFRRQLDAEAERAPLRTVRWHEIRDAREAYQPGKTAASSWLPRLARWSDQPLEALVLTPSTAEERSAAAREGLPAREAETRRLRAEAIELERVALEERSGDAAALGRAEAAIGAWREARRAEVSARRKAQVKPYDLLPRLLVFGLVLALVLAAGARAIGGRGSGVRFLCGFPVVYALAILAWFIAAQVDIRAAGIGYAAWAILLGLLVSNTVGTPRWVAHAAQTEYIIKTGLVLLGAEILFGKVLVIGLPGIFVAWIVTPVVLITTYVFGQRVLRIPSRSLNMTLSADMSVCGVSAAIATAAACRAKREELTLAVGISILFTSVMMVVMPNVIRAVGMDEILGGAWIGGTIDATGAVAAAGAFLGDRALHVAATIKMIQNILIGVVAFGVAVYWVTRVERDSTAGARPSAGEIWRRFPKFVLGFLAASIVFSLLHGSLGPDAGEALVTDGVIRGWSKVLRGWFFCLAFVSIGLATDFRSLGRYLKDGKALLLYVCGQSLNLALTLLAAWVMFRVVFAEIAESI